MVKSIFLTYTNSISQGGNKSNGCTLRKMGVKNRYCKISTKEKTKNNGCVRCTLVSLNVIVQYVSDIRSL
jgi:hypothetical protein